MFNFYDNIFGVPILDHQIYLTFEGILVIKNKTKNKNVKKKEKKKEKKNGLKLDLTVCIYHIPRAALFQLKETDMLYKKKET